MPFVYRAGLLSHEVAFRERQGELERLGPRLASPVRRKGVPPAHCRCSEPYVAAMLMLLLLLGIFVDLYRNFPTDIINLHLIH